MIFVPMKKEAGDWAMSFPWKVTNGTVCMDAKTKQEAIDLAYKMNRERGYIKV